jgi:putative FmdB family regulatory protein
MPTYVFECPVCEHIEEKVLSVSERNEAPSHCGTRMARIITAPHMQPDINPYQAVAGDRAGQWITSRSEHREYLKRNRLVEVGNEPIRPIKNDFRPRRGEVAEEMRHVVPDVLRRYRR